MKNKLFSLVLILLFILGLGIFILPQSKSSSQERRNLYTNEDVEILDLVKDLENILSDQFYFRKNILKTNFYINSTLASQFGVNVIDDVEAVQLTDDVVRMKDGYLAGSALKYNNAEIKKASQNGYYINLFDLKYPNVKTYVYKCTRIEELFNVEYPFLDKCWDTMLIQLNPNISYSKLSVNNFQDHKKYYYKTDHHWNAAGAYQGYKDIIEMIGKDYDIGNPKRILESISYPYEFKGTISANIGLLSESEQLTDYLLEDINDFDYYTDFNKIDYYKTRNDYLENGNTSNTQTDYELCFQHNSALQLFDFKNDNLPNLLIISTSLTAANNLWLASHFNKTLLVDLRGVDLDFDISAYIDKYDIDVALIQAGYHTLFDPSTGYPLYLLD